jgi:DNA-binding NarL/FixJ family response regulator
MIRVVIADDHPEVRLVLRLLLRLSSEIDFVGEAADGQAAVDAVKLFQPDILVMDVRMPVLDGLKAARQIAELGLNTSVILISLDRGGYMVKKAAEAGAKGFVPKDDIPTGLLAAIQAVYRGETFFLS